MALFSLVLKECALSKMVCHSSMEMEADTRIKIIVFIGCHGS